MPAVSVIMPAYNVAPYIGAAIESVLAQTCGDYELLVADDGSTDATARIAADYAQRDPRVKLLRKVNGGVSSARNHALRCAQGDVLALLDSDDIWQPAFLAAQLEILRARPDVDIVTTNAWYLGGTRDGQPVQPTREPRPDPTLADILADEKCIFIMSVMRRRVYETIGGFAEELRTNEDYDYWVRAAASGFKFARNNEPLAHYRSGRHDSLSACEMRMVQGILRVYDKTRPLLEGRPRELAILEQQYARFDAERLAAEARAAIESHDYRTASERLAQLYARRRSAAIGVARLMARFAPGLLSVAYRVHRARLGVAS